MTQNPRNTLGWPAHVAVPEGLAIKFVSMNHPMMRRAFEHAMRHQVLQAASGMRAVTSTLVCADEQIVMGVAGELCDTVTDTSKDDITYHAETGKCDRMQSDGNVDYDKCPGCKHSRHSERSAIFKALRDNVKVTNGEIFLYGQWWVCEPCANACVQAGVTTIHLLPDARELFDRSQPSQAERLAAFQEQWSK